MAFVIDITVSTLAIIGLLRTRNLEAHMPNTFSTSLLARDIL